MNSSKPLQSPRLDLDDKGIPKVAEILQAINSSPKNPHYYSPTPVRNPIARTPGTSIKYRQINSGVSVVGTSAPRITGTSVPSIPRSVVDTTSRSELNRAQRESKRKADKNTFDDYVPNFTAGVPNFTAGVPVVPVIPVVPVMPVIPSTSSIAQIQKTLELIQPGFVSYRTSGGIYTMPDYGTWSKLQREHCSYDFQRKITKLNKDWNKFGLYFNQPPAAEDITTTHIRHQDYLKVIKRKSGTSLWWILLGALWIGMEYVGTQVLGLKADGFAALQLKRYKLYEMHMIEMGEGSGFGQDWPPWLQMMITSALGLAVVVGIGTYTGKNSEYAGEIMDLLNGIITGQEAVEVDEDGNPVPGKESLMDKLSQIDLSNMSISKGLKMYRMFTGGTSKSEAADKPPKKTVKQTPEDRDKARKDRQRKAEAED